VKGYREAQVVELLRNEKLTVIIVGIVSELEKQCGKWAQKRATHLLKSLAKNAGARVFFIDATSDPEKITQQILGSMPQ